VLKFIIKFLYSPLFTVNNVGLGYEHPEFLNECSAEVSAHDNYKGQLFNVLCSLCRGCTK
jgi:hypothetical protein